MIRALAKRIAPWHAHVAAILVIIALSLATHAIRIAPLIRRYQERQLSVVQLAEQVGRGRELDAALKKTRDEVSDVRTFLKEHGIELEPAARLNDRLTAICALAAECGLVPEGIEPQRQAAEPLFTTVALRLSGRGSYENCARFLDRLHNEMPHNTITGIEIAGAPSAGESAVTFTFQIVWHAAPAP